MNNDPILERLEGELKAAWLTAYHADPASWAARLADPTAIAQVWLEGVLARLYLPLLAPGGRAWLVYQYAQAHSDETVLHRLVDPLVRPRDVGALLAGSIFEGIIRNEERFFVHDLLCYRGRWLTEAPFAERRSLLEQVFVEGPGLPPPWVLTGIGPPKDIAWDQGLDTVAVRLLSAASYTLEARSYLMLPPLPRS
jgi:hypothetical protein